MLWFKKKSNEDLARETLNKLTFRKAFEIMEEYLENHEPNKWQIIPRQITSDNLVKKLSFLNDIDNALLQLKENTWDKDLVDLIRGIIGNEYTKAETFLSVYDKKEYERFKKCQKTQ